MYSHASKKTSRKLKILINFVYIREIFV